MADVREETRNPTERVSLELELVIGTYESLLYGLVYDLLEDKPRLRSKFKEKGHMSCVRSAAASNNGILATGGSDEVIKLYNMRNHSEIGTLIQHDGTINYLSFDDNDKHLFSSSDDGTVCVWSTRDWQCLHQLTGHKGPVLYVAVHPTGKLALSVSKDKTIRTWDLLTGRCAYIKRLAEVIELVLWTPVGDAYIISSNNSFSLFSVQSDSRLLRVQVGHHINSIIFVKDDVVAVGSECHDVLFYSTADGNPLGSLKGHSNRIKCLCFVSGTDLLFSGSSDGSVRVWKLSEDNLSESECVTEASIAGRVTCMTLVYPEELEEREEGEGAKAKTRKRKRGPKPPTQDGNVSSQCVTVESTGGSSRALSEEGMRRLGRYVSVTFEDEEDVVDTNGGNTDEGQLVKRKRKRGKKKKKKNTGTARSIVTVEYEDDDKEEERETEEMLEESLPVKKSKSKRKKNDDPVSKIKLKETECVAKKAKKCKRRVQSSSSSLSV